jgi:hypothetical protein
MPGAVRMCEHGGVAGDVPQGRRQGDEGHGAHGKEGGGDHLDQGPEAVFEIGVHGG